MDKKDKEIVSKTISMLKDNAASTFNSSIVKNPDFKFGALLNADFSQYKNPLIISSADNIGSKLKFAIMSNKHDTIGIDLVAMSVNNIISTGAKPLFLSNYIGVNKIDKELIESIIGGVVKGCKKANCVLIGGETTEIPDMYLPGDYDLVGFTIGVVEKSKLLTPKNIQKGDLILGLYSSGLHFSGYRELQSILEEKELKLTDKFPHTTSSIQDIVLTPTRIYTEQVSRLLNQIEVHSLKQIEKSLEEGIFEIVPDEFDIEFYDFDMHEMFKTIMELGNFTEEEMFETFNCGIGMIVIIPEKEFDNVELAVGEKMKIIGKIL